MLYAADSTGAIGAAMSTAANGLRLAEFPGEEPSEKELFDWIKETMPMLRRAGYGPILRREIPPTLLHLTSLEIVPSELTPEQITAAGPIDSQKYDRTRLQVIRSNQQRKLQLTECMRGIRTQLHAMIEIAMKDRAPLRWRRAILRRTTRATSYLTCTTV